MAKNNARWIDYGTGTDQVNSRTQPANFTPTTSTPAQVASEGTDKVSAHLKGIDNQIASLGGGADDIGPSSFAGANNQVAAANVTDFVFSTANSFRAQANVQVDATADLFEVVEIQGIKKSADWEISQMSTGDDSGVSFSITSGGQVQYTSNNYAGFVSLTIEFRAQAL
jgi:hypothetical protein